MPPRPPRRKSFGPRRSFDTATDPAREKVIHRLSLQARRYPDMDIAPLDTDDLSPLDAAFAHAIYDAAMRRWLTLAYLLEASLTQPWETLEPKVKGAMLAGAAQIVLLDRIPPYAAVNASVEWAKQRVRTGAAAMVNAVLRRTVELVYSPESDDRVRRETWTDLPDEIPMDDGSALALAAPVMPTDGMSRLAVATSHPINLLRSWSRGMAIRDLKKRALHGIAHPPTILNTAHANPESPLPEQFLRRHNAPGHHVWTGPHETLVRFMRSRNDVWAQDPASSSAVESVADLRPSLVIDTCAGNGTKTRQLAYTFPEAQIVATDIAEDRVDALRNNFRTHPRIRVVQLKALDEWIGKADLVLLDVPCTNTGVLARRLEARYRFDEDRLAELVSKQKQILADSIRLLAPHAPGGHRGRILYATCSLDVKENDQQAEWVNRWHALSPSRARKQEPHGGPGEPPERWTDGSYSVLMG